MLHVTTRLIATALTMTVTLLIGGVEVTGAAGADTKGAATEAVRTDSRWTWPLERPRLERPFTAPAHRYGPGHRGVDLSSGGRPIVRAPAPGTVAFAGRVVDRDVLTIDHGSGLVSTLEPVRTDIAPGTAVDGGEPVGEIGAGGHSAAGTLHFGVRLHGEYINPLLLLGGVPRAVLLPCC